MHLRLLFLLACLAPLPAVAQSAPSAKSAALPTKDSLDFRLARNGDEVLITWAAASLETRGFDIMRNDRADPKGRVRVKNVRPESGRYVDRVPVADATYWYWIKITLPSGQIVNIGPVSSETQAVWAP